MVKRYDGGDFSLADHGNIVNWIAAGLLVLVVAWLGWTSCYTVEPNEEAVVLRAGKYLTTSQPGLHFRIPFLDTVLKVNTAEQLMRLPATTGSDMMSAAQLPEEETLMLTGDLNAAVIEWTIQWQVHDPEKFLFAFYDREDEQIFERVFRTAAKSVVNRLIGDYSVDEVLISERDELATEAEKATQAILDDYDCGVTVTALQMQRITPPVSVRPAFDAVNASIQERDRLENEAVKERNKLLPAARAEQDKLIREAEGYADRRIAEVAGEVAALRAKYEAYKQAPEETRHRLYLEAMQEVLQNVDQTTVLDSALGNLLPLLPLDRSAVGAGQSR